MEYPPDPETSEGESGDERESHQHAPQQLRPDPVRPEGEEVSDHEEGPPEGEGPRPRQGSHMPSRRASDVKPCRGVAHLSARRWRNAWTNPGARNRAPHPDDEELLIRPPC